MNHLNEFWALFLGLLPLSMLSIGGAITVVPAIHTYTVQDHAWLTDTQFGASVAIAQAAPGPNILFVAVIGWHAGLTWAAQLPSSAWWISYGYGIAGALTALLGITLPSSVLNYFAGRWIHQNNEQLLVRAFKAGMAPIVLALLICAGWILASNAVQSWQHWPAAAITGVAAVAVWRTKINLLILLSIGATIGALGWV